MDTETKRYLDKKFDDFALVVAGGFAAVDNRFDGVEKRLDRIEIRLVDNDHRLDGIEGRLTTLEHRHERTFNRMDDFLVLANRHESEIAALRGSYERLERRGATS